MTEPISGLPSEGIALYFRSMLEVGGLLFHAEIRLRCFLYELETENNQ